MAAGHRALDLEGQGSVCHLELELMNELRERAEEEAIRVFGRTCKDLPLAAPPAST